MQHIILDENNENLKFIYINFVQIKIVDAIKTYLTLIIRHKHNTSFLKKAL